MNKIYDVIELGQLGAGVHKFVLWGYEEAFTLAISLRVLLNIGDGRYFDIFHTECAAQFLVVDEKCRNIYHRMPIHLFNVMSNYENRRALRKTEKYVIK